MLQLHDLHVWFSDRLDVFQFFDDIDVYSGDQGVDSFLIEDLRAVLFFDDGFRRMTFSESIDIDARRHGFISVHYSSVKSVLIDFDGDRYFNFV